MLTPLDEIKEPVRILTEITTVDASGGEVKGYGLSEVIWISLRAMTANENISFGQVGAQASHVAFGHYGDLVSVTSKDRIRSEITSEEYDIVGAPIHSPDRDWMKLILLWRENG